MVSRGNGAGGTAKAVPAAGVRHGRRSRQGAVALDLAAGAAGPARGHLLGREHAVHSSLVYVGNAGTASTNFTGFRLAPSGHLFPVLGSTVPVASNSEPGDVLFNRTGTKLVGTSWEHRRSRASPWASAGG
jgi:hypothetical protein